ncbi:MAG: hypothetical protein A2Y38_25180, partial [Spirochaetes bacterium GWB1_59_5]
AYRPAIAAFTEHLFYRIIRTRMTRRPFRAAILTATIAVIILSAIPARAQGPAEPLVSGAPLEGSSAEAEPDLLQATLALDIASADYYALVAWVRQLGLSETGRAQDLRSRLYEHFNVKAPPVPEASSKTITIVSADTTEYLSAHDEGESSVRFTGRVRISVKDDDSGERLTIAADQIVVNRDANILSATGDIVFERTKSDGSDIFMGEALELDMDDWSGVFLDGESKRGSGAAANALFFRADDILKRGTDVMVFKDGVVSSCADENPHYSIRAAKIWILGGNEWAMQNATLSVGEIPLLYLPFFYYPGEEIVFHPVFGYDERFGRSVQTTTYLLGEKEPKEQEISLLKISEGGSGYERVIEGVFLRTTREKKKGTTTDFVKVIVDLYSTLGGFAATQAKVAAWGPFTSIVGFAGLGLTRSAFANSDGAYTPFVAANDYTSTWNEVDLYGTPLPFRFGWELASSVDLGPVKVSFSAPYYSDSYYNRDFKDRTENMNWLEFLDQDKDESTISKIASFTDTVSLTASLPSSLLPPWLSAVSLSKLSSSLTWNSVLKATPTDAGEKILFAVDPAREFFAPYEWTMLDAAGTVSGTLFKYPRAAAARTAASEAGAAGIVETGVQDPGDQPLTEDAIATALKSLPALEAPWAETEKPVSATASSAADFMPPPLATPESIAERVPFSTSLGWSWSPSYSLKRRFLTSAWKVPADVDWSSLYDTSTIRNAGTLTLAGAMYDGLLGITAGLSASTQYQDRLNITENPLYASDALLATWAKQDAQYRNDKVAATLKLTSSPFQDFWLWSPTSLSYSLSSTLYEYAFKQMGADPTDASMADYEEITADWTEDTISAHSLALNLGLKPWGYAQSLTLAADMPPLLQGYSAKLNLKALWATLSVGTAYTLPTKDEEFEWDPLSSSLTLGSAPWPVFTGSFRWNIESGLPVSTSAAMAWNGLSASLSAREAIAYTLTVDEGWSSTGEPAFRISSAALGFTKAWAPPASWQQRIAWTLNVNAAAQQSFLRFTDSYLNFVLGLSLKVHEFLDITFSSTSRNSSLWRYYPGLFTSPSNIDLTEFARNPLVDIIKSFNFFDGDESDRKESLFKLKSLSVTATHYLHDWDLAATFSASPVLDADTLEYYFKTSFALTLSWRSVSQIKSTYKRDGETVSWK